MTIFQKISFVCFYVNAFISKFNILREWNKVCNPQIKDSIERDSFTTEENMYLYKSLENNFNFQSKIDATQFILLPFFFLFKKEPK